MTTAPDQLFQFGGVPVGSGVNYYGWWNQGTYFVDYDNGTATQTGDEIGNPAKNLATVISAADKWDTIYIRPRDPSVTGGDSNYITPASATNWTIPAAKFGMSLVGTGLGRDGHGMAYQTYLRGHASVTTGSVLEIRPPFCVIENLAFHRGGGATTGMVAFAQSAGVYSGFSGSANNCLFRFHNGTTVDNAALVIKDSWYVQVYNCIFYRNVVGVGIYALNSSARSVAIRNCVFEGKAADVNNHILSNGTADYITIADNIFQDAIPTKGSNDYYIYISGGASTGIVANNVFGTTTATASTLCTLNGLTFAKNYVSGVSAIIGQTS